MDIEASTINGHAYVVGDTFRVKDQVKRLGGTWDGFRQAWKFVDLKTAEAAAAAARTQLAMLLELDALA